MKNIRLFAPAISLLLTLSCFIGCTEEKDNSIQPVAQINIDTVTFENSMKGWELYSWPNGNDWNYSILPGTNRIKSYDEVINNKFVVVGKDSLKLLLNKIPENQYIFWISEDWLARCWHSGYKNLSLPDKGTINEIKDFCQHQNLVLNVCE